jgi:cobalamin biosynthetic protein CobC
MDLTPEESLIEAEPIEGLIVLRSIGKFFGLAGIRLGFVWAKADILAGLIRLQDDWSVSNPARWAGRLALNDTHWQAQQRQWIPQSMENLKAVLESIYQREVMEAGLFAYVTLGQEKAQNVYENLSRNAVLTRLFESAGALRFGLSLDVPEYQLKQCYKLYD